MIASLRELRSEPYDLAIDFQGLIKSAVVARLARPLRLVGFRRGIAREGPATFLYSEQVDTRSMHTVDMRLDLAAAAGASNIVRTFALPEGRPEGDLPAGEFVLASPLAGWRSKQWPIEHYRDLAPRLRRDLGMPLVLNGLARRAGRTRRGPRRNSACLRHLRIDSRYAPRRRGDRRG